MMMAYFCTTGFYKLVTFFRFIFFDTTECFICVEFRNSYFLLDVKDESYGYIALIHIFDN